MPIDDEPKVLTSVEIGTKLERVVELPNDSEADAW